MIAVLAALALITLPPPSTGQCGWVHGRFAIYNGSSVARIWIIGTRRIIALYDDDVSYPPDIKRYVDTKDIPSGLEDALFGDFHVCAVENSRPGYMQHVRLMGTKHLIFHGKKF